MKKLDLFAFWRYDRFPYLLGGPVSRMNPNGAVETENYGTGYWWKPVKLVPRAQGPAILAVLKALEREHDAAISKVRAEFEKRREELFKQFGIEERLP